MGVVWVGPRDESQVVEYTRYIQTPLLIVYHINWCISVVLHQTGKDNNQNFKGHPQLCSMFKPHLGYPALNKL